MIKFKDNKERHNYISTNISKIVKNVPGYYINDFGGLSYRDDFVDYQVCNFNHIYDTSVTGIINGRYEKTHYKALFCKILGTSTYDVPVYRVGNISFHNRDDAEKYCQNRFNKEISKFRRLEVSDKNTAKYFILLDKIEEARALKVEVYNGL